ncbi:hypothetical protein FISHEDRAFT_75815 [Fistulina hepatica ATCC 64428]|uniref:Shugoshin C-terminal domain-containing protein n=1 Tax=Fistulina hepatica ATCC 64428 TaxID=1128425 RepID=A0A0D7A684_9AGAR|nr:hypothetical protein FISHEDRAFT_75815 [Fistulina hepatica ATCC 64428]
MSRRQSRNSLNTGQNDALFEFETYKKKFLLANKHITKLNSTLSVRIEELNAQISELYNENLRLRASEIALARQLKQERDKTRRVMADAETASQLLAKQLSTLRHTFNIRNSPPSSPKSTPPPPKRPVFNPPSPNPSPVARLAQVPSVPDIVEDEEPTPSEREEHNASPLLRKKARLSSSRLPLPSRTVPPLSMPSIDLELAVPKRKSSRRESGLLTPVSVSDALAVPRSSSPAFGSPIRRAAGFAEQCDEAAAMNGDVDGLELFPPALPVAKKEKRKSKSRTLESADVISDVYESEPPVKEKKRSKHRDIDALEAAATKTRERERVALMFSDVTNAPLSSMSNSPLPSIPSVERATIVEVVDLDTNLGVGTHSSSDSSPAPLSTEEALVGLAGESLLPSCDTPVPGGRERRTRKSVNYAEPKLNTKMRKPDPPPGTVLPKKRTSRKSSADTHHRRRDDDHEGDNSDVDGESDAARPRRRATISDVVACPPLPAPLSSGSSSGSTGTLSAKSSEDNGSQPSDLGGVTLRRQKSRHIILSDDDGSDGADADEEYVSSGRGSKGSSRSGSSGRSSSSMSKSSWVSIETRRRSTVVGSRTSLEIDDARRHSLAV